MSVGAGAPLVLATRSAGKLRELRPMLAEAGFVPVSLDELRIPVSSEEDEVEAFSTFEENSLAKARYFLARAGGRAVLADDSGLAVLALGGQPGVRSKRWAAASGLDGHALDAANNAKLLAELRPHEDKRAEYVCVATIAWPGGEVTGRGACSGVIVGAARGQSGFGYDPLFLSDELGVTFGEASTERKAAISHRARAVRAALQAFAERAR